MRKDSRITLLRSVPGLGHYPDKALARLAPLFDVCEIDAGQELTHEGDPSREMFLVVEGEAVVIMGGQEIAAIGPGQFIGEMGMLDHRPRSATVVADTPMVVLVVGPRNFGQVVEAPALLRRMSADLAARLRAIDRPVAPS